MAFTDETLLYVTNISSGLCTCFDYETVESIINTEVVADLSQAVNETIGLLLTQGGDFLIQTTNRYQVTIRNKSKCPGLKYQDNNDRLQKCIQLEQFLKKYCSDTINSKIDVNFTECSCDNDSYCEIMFSIDP